MEESTQKQEILNKKVEGGERRNCWARFFSLFRAYNVQRQQSKQEELVTEGDYERSVEEKQIQMKNGR